MFKIDIIKTYIFEQNYYEYVAKEENNNYFDLLRISNNNLYYILNIKISKFAYFKTKQIKQNYIIFICFNYYSNNNIYSKVKNYDNTKLDINNFYFSNSIPKYDLIITNNSITKKNR